MLDGRTMIILLMDYVFLYGGCIFDIEAMRLAGGTCLLAMAVIAVFPKRKRQEEGGK